MRITFVQTEIQVSTHVMMTHTVLRICTSLPTPKPMITGIQQGWHRSNIGICSSCTCIQCHKSAYINTYSNYDIIFIHYYYLFSIMCLFYLLFIRYLRNYRT